MSDNNFEKEFESASQDLMNQPVVENLEPEMQEQLRQIESLASMDPSFANSKEYQDLVNSLVKSSSQASEDDEDERDEQDATPDVRRAERLKERVQHGLRRSAVGLGRGSLRA